MDKQEIIRRIEKFALPELAESWDCSGSLVETDMHDVQKIMLALTVTQDVVRQAKEQNCDMIISHHPLFFIPMEWKDIEIYCAHTNLDKTKGGTTDTLIKTLELPKGLPSGDFLRIVDYETTVFDFSRKLSKITKILRIVNNNKIHSLKKIAFCAGSGSDFIEEAFQNGADALVTGDVKFHTALESPIVLFDAGHFESEIPVLGVFEKLLNDSAEIVKAEEKSPFYSG